VVWLHSTELDVLVSPLYGAIANVWDKQGQACLWGPQQGEEYLPSLGGCFPLTPYCNRIRNGRFQWQGQHYAIDCHDMPQPHALHGDGWRNRWEIKHAQPQRVVLEHRGCINPFHYCATQTICLSGNRLLLDLSITHLGTVALPYGLGFHPWFQRDCDTRLWAQAQSVWMEDAEHLPTHETAIPARWNFAKSARVLPIDPINNLFTGWLPDDSGQHQAVLSYPSRHRRIDINSSYLLNRYMLYGSGGDFICFEPVSHNIDAHNSKNTGGLIELNKGESLSAWMSLRFST
jgi:aldose 1-epimerase